MGLLKPVGAVEYLKGGFLGFNKSGKTWTMALLVIGVRQHFGLTGPIAMYDTEGGSEYIGPLVQALTGTTLLVVKSRSLDDLSATVEECIDEKASVLIAESMTHVWRNLCDSYLADVNQRRKGNRQSPRHNLEFQDWGPLKGIWAERWADRYLNAPLHILIAGRAGYEYDMQENEETHKKELIKTGVKMKTEGEFGFEPSLLVEMERESLSDGKGGFKISRRATVLGDRFGVIDARTGLFAEEDRAAALAETFAFFQPHVALLKSGGHTPINTTARTETGASQDGDGEWSRERKTREILCEEIAGEFVAHNLAGQAKEDKERRLGLLYTVFGTRSWTAVESKDSTTLRYGLEKIRLALRPPPEDPAALERQLRAALCQQQEQRLGLDFAEVADHRSDFGITGGLELADLDQLIAYEESLKALVTP